MSGAKRTSVNVKNSDGVVVADGSSVATGGSTVSTVGRKPTMSDKRLQTMLAFVFGVVFLACILVLAVFVPNPTPQQFEIFRIVIALAAGGVAAVIPGMLDLNLERGPGLALRAGGALAVFVIVFFYSPARWVIE